MIHLYCLAVQAGFYSDVVECSPQDGKVPGSILGRDMEIFLRVRDTYVVTPHLNHLDETIQMRGHNIWFQ